MGVVRKDSEVLKQILRERIAYRNDNIYDSGVEDAFDIIEYEILELGNVDIIETMSIFYNINIDSDNLEDVLTQIYNFLFKYFDTNQLYAKWFSTKEGIEKYYVDEEDYYISKYAIPNNAICISDMGLEGVLLVSDEEFDIIEEVEINKKII